MNVTVGYTETGDIGEINITDGAIRCNIQPGDNEWVATVRAATQRFVIAAPTPLAAAASAATAAATTEAKSAVFEFGEREKLRRIAHICTALEATAAIIKAN